VGSSNQTIDIRIAAKTVEISTLYVMLPQHFALLANGANAPEVVASRKRLGDVCSFNPFSWEEVEERVRDLFARGKLRHVATEAEALAEMERVKKFYSDTLRFR
jgi:hypothetical protein